MANDGFSLSGGLMQALKTRMHYQQSRQKVLAENVANADSPGFRPVDLKPPSADPARAGVAVARTSAGHMSLNTANGGFDGTGAPRFETTPNGNAVNLEDEMLKVAQNQSDYQLAASLYSKGLGLMKIAIGKGALIMDLIKSIAVAASGLRSQSGRMRIISENIANADSGPEKAGAEPYRRKVPTFQRHMDRTLDAQLVALGKVQRDPSAFKTKHEPGNPAADANGNVQMPNVNSLVEMVDMREAQRSYEANLNLISSTRRMIQRTIDILRA